MNYVSQFSAGCAASNAFQDIAIQKANLPSLSSNTAGKMNEYNPLPHKEFMSAVFTVRICNSSWQILIKATYFLFRPFHVTILPLNIQCGPLVSLYPYAYHNLLIFIFIRKPSDLPRWIVNNEQPFFSTAPTFNHHGRQIFRLKILRELHCASIPPRLRRS